MLELVHCSIASLLCQVHTHAERNVMLFYRGTNLASYYSSSNELRYKKSPPPAVLSGKRSKPRSLVIAFSIAPRSSLNSALPCVCAMPSLASPSHPLSLAIPLSAVGQTHACRLVVFFFPTAPPSIRCLILVKFDKNRFVCCAAREYGALHQHSNPRPPTRQPISRTPEEVVENIPFAPKPSARVTSGRVVRSSVEGARKKLFACAGVFSRVCS